MATLPIRLVVRPQDIASILGISLRQAYRHYHQVRDAYKKSQHHVLTIEEFASYYDILLDVIQRQLK